MQIKIVSDGTSRGTHVVNAETGEAIGMIQSLEWRIDATTQLAEATIHVLKVPVEIMASVIGDDELEKVGG